MHACARGEHTGCGAQNSVPVGHAYKAFAKDTVKNPHTAEITSKDTHTSCSLDSGCMGAGRVTRSTKYQCCCR